MFKLKFIPEKQLYEIHSNGEAYEGTLWSIKQKACQMGIDSNEFDLAINEMMHNGHEIADFSVLGKFILSKNK